MAGTFELFVDADAYFRFRLRAPDGEVLVVSKAFADKPAAVAGISAVREYAGMGLISDLCPGDDGKSGGARPRAASTPATGVDRRVHDNEIRIRARALRRPAHGPGAVGVASHGGDAVRQRPSLYASMPALTGTNSILFTGWTVFRGARENPLASRWFCAR